jgi:hypothetical protein
VPVTHDKKHTTLRVMYKTDLITRRERIYKRIIRTKGRVMESIISFCKKRIKITKM